MLVVDMENPRPRRLLVTALSPSEQILFSTYLRGLVFLPQSVLENCGMETVFG